MSAEITNLFQPKEHSAQPGQYVATWYDYKDQCEYDLRYHKEEGMYLVVNNETDNLVDYFNDEDMFTQMTRMAQIASQTVMTVVSLNQ